MKNSRKIKQASRLTGSLLARKGTAAPSSESVSMTQGGMSDFLEDAIMSVKKLSSRQNGYAQSEKQFIQSEEPEGTVTAGPVTTVKGKVSYKKSKFAKSSTVSTAKKRVAMTLRMDDESHLKLRLHSAYTRKSCQIIISEALNLYLAKNDDKFSISKSASQK